MKVRFAGVLRWEGKRGRERGEGGREGERERRRRERVREEREGCTSIEV